MPLRFLILSICWPGITSFPITTLELEQSVFDELKQATGDKASTLATGALLPAMQKIFKEAKYAIQVEKGDVVVKASFPDEQVDNDCHHKIEAEHPVATGVLKNSSYLKFGVANLSWHGVTVFADAEVDASLDIDTDVCVRVGREVFGHHCSQFGRKTVGINVLSDGKNGLGLNMTASNAHLAQVNGTWSLVFNFHASVVGRVISWNVEEVHARNCKIKILGIEIASVCGLIEKNVKAQAQKLTDHVTQVTAPNLLKKLENKINTAIGSTVTIPLKIAHEIVI